MSFVDLENVLWDGFHWVDIPGDILSIITKRKFHEIYLSKKNALSRRTFSCHLRYFLNLFAYTETVARTCPERKLHVYLGNYKMHFSADVINYCIV